ncbi:MAG: DNA repair exonuclease [Desulfurococcaceae archaeon]
MVLIVHTSDIHLGVDKYANSPLAAAYVDVFNEIAEKTVEAGSRYLVVAGDMFHSTDPSTEVILSAIRVLKKLKESGVRVVVVPGNHDNSTIRRGILDVLAEAGLVHLLEYREEYDYLLLKPLVFEDDRLVFYGIPGFRWQKELNYIGKGMVKYLERSKYENYSTVVVAHTSAKVYNYDPTSYSTRYGKIATDEGELLRRIPQGAKYIALGHIHIPVPLEKTFRSNSAYPGAPIGMDASDLRESVWLAEMGVKRRILLVDIQQYPSSIRAIELENTPFVAYREIEAHGPSDVMNQLMKIVSELPSEPKHKVVLLYLKNVEELDARILGVAKEMSIKRGVHVEVNISKPEESSGLLSALSQLGELKEVDTERTLLDIDTLEERILEDLARRYKLPLSLDKLKWLLNKLAEPVPSSSKYRDILLQIEKELLES